MEEKYRLAASVMVLKPMEVCTREGCKTIHQFLLLHKPRKNDAWQLPQGGVEQGETEREGALRELKEEAGISDTTFLASSPKVYQYDFPPSYRHFRPDNICGQKISFVFTLVEPEARVEVDGKEVDAHAWVDPSQLQLYVHRKEYLELLQGLYEEALRFVEEKPSVPLRP
ncbi:MAG: NUDIX domain-containing protein [Candidatus Peribacteraceae bacterium]|jgi:putative (di)nucleoside polyphosphate hydrolase